MAKPSKRSRPSDGGPSKTSKSCSKRQKGAKLSQLRNSPETGDGQEAQTAESDLGREAEIRRGTDGLGLAAGIGELHRTEKVRRNFLARISTKTGTSSATAAPNRGSVSVAGRRRTGGKRSGRLRRSRGRSPSLNRPRRRRQTMRNLKLRSRPCLRRPSRSGLKSDNILLTSSLLRFR